MGGCLATPHIYIDTCIIVYVDLSATDDPLRLSTCKKTETICSQAGWRTLGGSEMLKLYLVPLKFMLSNMIWAVVCMCSRAQKPHIRKGHNTVDFVPVWVRLALFVADLDTVPTMHYIYTTYYILYAIRHRMRKHNARNSSIYVHVSCFWLTFCVSYHSGMGRPRRIVLLPYSSSTSTAYSKVYMRTCAGKILTTPEHKCTTVAKAMHRLILLQNPNTMF